ncbi:MAG: hypothetical protein K2R98_20865 [Gemmataceae bacterium]|nr:hypothetical protein [Gemmataceae bacterium]
MNDLISEFVFTIWCLAGCLAAFMVVPPLFHVLGLSRYAIGVDDPGGESLFGDNDPVPPMMLTQLHDLGFKPLATVREHVWFFHIHWTWSLTQRIYGSRNQGCYASLYRFVSGEPLRMAFATVFTDGAEIWTGNSAAEIQIREDDYWRQGFLTGDLKELMARHQEAVQAFVADGRSPGSHDRLEPFMETTERLTRRHLRTHRQGPLNILATWATMLALFPALMYFNGEREALTLGLGLLGGSIGLLVLRYLMLRQVGEQRRAEVEGHPSACDDD